MKLALFLAALGGAIPAWGQLSGVKDGGAVARGAIEGVLLAPAGSDRTVGGVKVTLLRTRATAEVDGTGHFAIEDVPPGSYTLLAAGEGFSMLVITDVVVRPRQRVLLDAEEMPLAIREGDIVRMEPVVVSARKQIEALERYEITEQRPEPFATGNVDLPRTIDDPQPYYLFDRRAIGQAGATTLEEFVQRRVPMDATKLRLAQNAVSINTGLGIADNKSAINLNGFGAEHTAILVNGRRLPSLSTGGLQNTARQPDFNGIPVAAIERIELLPASSSAIYGSDATGGVMNIVLRQDFQGAEIEGSIENPYHGSAPIYRAAFTVGRSFNAGRTNVMISASYIRLEALEYRHRRELLEGYRDRAWANDPVTANAPSYANIPLGRTTNIMAMPVTRVVEGMPITEPGSLFGPGTSDRTFVPEGYAGGGGLAALEVNAGKLDLEPTPDASGRPPYWGMHSPLELETESGAIYATLRHRLGLRMEVFAELSHSKNEATNHGYPGAVVADIPAAAPTNIFGVPVRVAARVAMDLEPSRQEIIYDRVVVGTRMELPGDWIGQVDAGLTTGQVRRSAEAFLAELLQSDARNGGVDLLRDLRANPIPMNSYFNRNTSRDGSWVRSVNLRAGGSAWHLPAGAITTAFGVGVEESAREDSYTRNAPVTPGRMTLVETVAPGGSQRDTNMAGEAWVPLFSRANARRAMAQLDLQLAGRWDRFDVRDVDSTGRDVTYEATSFTAGVRYRPVGDLMWRVSYSSGFRAPDFAEIRPSPPPLSHVPFSHNGWLPLRFADPKRGGETNARSTASYGGNTAVRPERSENVTAGLVLEPRVLPGLRLSVDLTSIRRRDEIRVLPWQSIVDYEDLFPGRVVRDPLPAGDRYEVGPIAFVDGSMMNVFSSRSVNYNFTVEYERMTAQRGRWNFFLIGNSWQHYQRRLTAGHADEELINSAGMFTQGQPKFVGIAGVNWTGGRWSAGWAARFYGHHRVGQSYTGLQGGEVVTEQMYHDVYVGYAFPAGEGRGARRVLSGVAVQLGAKNLFNTAPRFDGASARFYSTYGDLRRGSVYLSLRKRF